MSLLYWTTYINVYRYTGTYDIDHRANLVDSGGNSYAHDIKILPVPFPLCTYFQSKNLKFCDFAGSLLFRWEHSMCSIIVQLSICILYIYVPTVLCQEAIYRMLVLSNEPRASKCWYTVCSNWNKVRMETNAITVSTTGDGLHSTVHTSTRCQVLVRRIAGVQTGTRSTGT